MLISSHFFLLYFFPVVLAIQLLVHKHEMLSRVWILLVSGVFYATFHVQYLPLLASLLVADYFLVHRMTTLTGEPKRQLLLVGVLSNLVLLGYYKYSGFLVETVRELTGSHWLSSFSPITVLPVGISFFTFQRISYWVDVYREKTSPATTLVDYLIYAAFFPQLIAGPIVRFSDVRTQLVPRPLTWVDLYAGLKMVSVGLFLKSFVADNLFVLESDLTNELARLTTISMSALIAVFSLRIYFDFLGYSLLALGLARFFKFTFPINFASPYRAVNVRDFWRRWNITLSQWLRDYLYIPLGGNRGGALKTYRNLLITMLLAGLWHGASWSMVAWGGIHGIALVIHRWISEHIPLSLPVGLGRALTFIFVTVAWIPFKFTRGDDIALVFEALYSLSWQWYDPNRINLMINTLPTVFVAIIWMWKARDEDVATVHPTTKRALGYTLLFMFSLGWSLVRRSVPFIYFQF